MLIAFINNSLFCSNIQKEGSEYKAKINQLENDVRSKEKSLEETSKRLADVNKEHEGFASKNASMESKLLDLEKELKNERQLLQSNSKEFQCKSDEIDELLSKHNLATETITKLQTEKSDPASVFESYKKETKDYFRSGMEVGNV